MVKGLVADLYTQLTGKTITNSYLNTLFTAPWLILPDIRSALEDINNMNEALAEIEKAA